MPYLFITFCFRGEKITRVLDDMKVADEPQPTNEREPATTYNFANGNRTNNLQLVAILCCPFSDG